MSAWICRECTAAYAVDVPSCPQCGTNNPIMEDEQLRLERQKLMPKIHVNRPPTIDDPTADSAETDHGEGVEEGETEGGPSKPLPDVTDDPDAANEEKTSEPDYEAWTVPQLQAALKERKLPTTGNKPELIDRLLDHDTAPESTSVQAGTAEGSGGASS